MDNILKTCNHVQNTISFFIRMFRLESLLCEILIKIKMYKIK